jgi:para-nitrobenzyl esterase
MKPSSRNFLLVASIAAIGGCTSPSLTGPTDNPDPSGSNSGSNSGSANGSAAPTPACPVAPSTDPLVVATDRGLVKGVQAGTGFAFLGIPYAAPPVGSLRFMPPQSAACRSDVFDASNFGNICAQWNTAWGGLVGSEDCLSINVWTPSLPTASSTPLPVLFWIYGGADLIGASNWQGTYGQFLANSKNAVVVSFNYRLGPLGFLAHPALLNATPEATTGNNGLLDVIAALQWVQTNIAAFGGDKNHVLLFGESAGAINTCALVASPLATGLFSSALMESGNCAAEGLTYRYIRGEAEVAAAGCALATDVVGCMQNAPVDSILNAGGDTFIGSFVSQILTTSINGAHLEDLPWGPTVDGYVLNDTPQHTIQTGAHNHVPLVIGTNSIELAAMLPQMFPQQPIMNCVAYDAFGAVLFPGLVVPMLQTFPCNPWDPPSAFNQAVRLAGDGFFHCPSRRALRGAAVSQSEPVYRYLFTHGVATHSAEVPYVFGDMGIYLPASADDLKLQDQIESYWVNLAATGNPNGAGLPTWDAYDPSADNALVLDTPITSTTAIDWQGCAFWDSVQ